MPEKRDDPSPNIFPTLRYRDSSSALDWLGRAFGFEKGAVYPSADGSVAHAELALGPGVVMVGTMREGTDNPWNAARFGIYVYVEDVEAHYERARAAGAEIVRELAEMSYGAREYSARDLEGNLWSFGTYLPER